MQSQNNLMGPQVAAAAGIEPALRQGEGVQPTTPMTFDQFFQRGQANDSYLSRRLIDPNNPGLTDEQYRASEQERALGDFDNYLNNFGQSDMGLREPPQQIGDMFNLGANSPVIQSGVQPTTQGINQPQSPYEMRLGDFDNYVNNFGQSDMGLREPPQQIGDMFKSVTNMPPAASYIVQSAGQPQSPYAMQLASIFGPAGPSQSNSTYLPTFYTRDEENFGNFSQEIGPAVRKEIIDMAQSNGGGMQGPQYNQPMQRYNEGPQRQFANEYQSQLYDTMKAPNQSPLGVGGLAALLQQR
jgi:hypothetical protein